MMIYQLLAQILDPCSYVRNEIEFIEELENSPHSIITQTVAVYHGYVLCIALQFCFA